MENNLIDIYTFTWNEEFLAPYVLQYWKLLPVRKVFVIDNESTDNTLNILTQWDKVEVITRKSNNTFDDIELISWKNNIWKRSRGKVPCVIVSDFDEVIYCPTIINELNYMLSKNYSLLSCSGIEFICNDFNPKINLLHNDANMKFNYYDKNHNNRKKILFNPNLIDNINYDVGAHVLRPIGKGEVYYQNKIFLFHIKFITINYILSRYEKYRNRLSQNNKLYNLGGHYNHDNNYLINDFKEKLKTSESFDEIIKKCISIKLD